MVRIVLAILPAVPVVAVSAQDSTRTALLLEAGGGWTDFNIRGDSYDRLDSLYKHGYGLRFGVVARSRLGKRTALRSGLSMGWREFSSITHEFRFPASGTDHVVIETEQRNSATFLGITFLFEWTPKPWLSLLGGCQVVGIVSMNSKATLNQLPVEVDLQGPPLEVIGGVEFRPSPRIGLGARYMHQVAPIYEQSYSTPTYPVRETYDRTHWWYAVEATLTVRVGH